MSILQGVGAASALLQGATNLVREFKRPGLTDSTFAEMLRQTREASDPATVAKRADATATLRMNELMTLRDINGDGLLSKDESGLKADDFAAADLDGDGMLSTEEVKQAILRDADLGKAGT